MPTAAVSQSLTRTAAQAAQLPRTSWGTLVDALRKGASRDAVIDEMTAMLRAVAAACKG
jgi:hypothetical protein